MAPVSGRPIPAAGAVVTGNMLRGTEVVIVHRRYDDWTLPKGKLDVGESLPACAVREVQEEGVKIRLSARWTRSATKRQRWPQEGRLLGRVVLDSVRRAPDEEVDVVSWLPVRAAPPLTYSHDHFLVQQYLGRPPTR